MQSALHGRPPVTGYSEEARSEGRSPDVERWLCADPTAPLSEADLNPRVTVCDHTPDFIKGERACPCKSGHSHCDPGYPRGQGRSTPSVLGTLPTSLR